MTVKEVIGGAGSWSVELSDETPDEIVAQLGMFGHIVIVRGRVDVDATNAALLAKARYVGILRSKSKGTPTRTIGGPGMVIWLGDEDEKGKVIETAISLTSATLTAAITALLPPAVTLGTIYPLADPTARYTGKFQYVTPRTAIQTVCDAFGVEFRVNGDGTIDVGRQDQLYVATPTSLIVRKGAGSDFDLSAIGGTFETDIEGEDYTTRALLLGSRIGSGTTPDETFVTARVDAATVPYSDIHGNRVYFTRMISESSTDSATNATQRAQLFLNEYNRLKTSLKVTAEDYETTGSFRCGDNAFVYDPDNGIANAAYERDFRGQLLHPDVIRITEFGWPVTADHTVAFRTSAGAWLDLTRYVIFENGSNELVVGDLPKSLTSTSNPVTGRTDSGLVDKVAPKSPTGLVLTTSSTVGPKGTNSAIITASWTAPTQSADNTALTDLAYYLVRYRIVGSTNWQSTATLGTVVDLPAIIALTYEVQVAAVDQSNNASAFATAAGGNITASVDTVAPPAPADPVVSNYLGQLRIEYAGTDNLGNPMPADTNRIDVHVDTTSGFAPTIANRVSSLTPFAKGVAYATAPYSLTDNRWVRLVAYDHTGNASPASGSVGGHTAWVGTADIANLAVTSAQIASLDVGKLTAGTMTADVVTSGRFTTALTGARRELNAVGFQAWDSSGNQLISLDGVNNLLTGILKTAVSGRRIEIGASGNSGRVEFYSAAGDYGYLASTALAGGAEGLTLSLPLVGGGQGWNALRLDTTGLAFLDAKYVHVAFGGAPGGGGDFRLGFATDRGSSSTFPTQVDRFFVDESNIYGWYNTSGGQFAMSELNLSNGIQVIRQQMFGGGNTIFTRSPGGDFTVMERPVGGASSNYERFRVLDDNIYIRFAPPKDGRLAAFRIGPLDSTTYFSPEMLLLSSNGYGGFFRFQTGSSGSGSKMILRDAGDSIYEDLFVGTLTQSSTRKAKKAIRPLSEPATDKITALQGVTYNRKRPEGWEEARTLGIIAEEAERVAPEIVSQSDYGAGINVLPFAVLIMTALQETIRRVEELEGKAS